MSGWELPEQLEIGGRVYAIHADYRDVLDIIARLKSGEEPEQVRVYIALALFYADFSSMPGADWPEATEQLMRFINCGEPASENAPPPSVLIDWQQDRLMIVADVNKVAGCEVRALPYLHWWTFVAWFKGIGEGQLSTVVSIRAKLRKGKKLEKWENEYLQEHREVVILKPHYTAEELAEQQRLKELLGD